MAMEHQYSIPQLAGYEGVVGTKDSEPGYVATLRSVRALIQERLVPSAKSKFDFNLRVEEKDGIVTLTGTTYSRQMHDAFTAFVSRIKELPGVKSVDVSDVVHGEGLNPVPTSALFASRKIYIEWFERHFKAMLEHYHSLRVDPTEEGVRIMGRIEFADEYETFLLIVKDFKLMLGDYISVDMSRVTTSDLPSAVVKPGK